MILFDKTREHFSIFDSDGHLRYGCRMTNEVRNEINGRRRLHLAKDVVFVVTKNRTLGPAYMPRQFPDGMANVVAVEVNPGHPMAKLPGVRAVRFNASEFGTVRITTDATQIVATWSLGPDGGYEAPDGNYADDYGYHFHYAPGSTTTLGCGRFATQEFAEAAAKIVAQELAAGRVVKVKVG